MKTPIPEKIKTEIGCGEVNTTIGIAMKFSQNAHIVNHFIDVLTEQQKEIDELKNHVHIAHVNSLVGQTEAPYTAMRSTGGSGATGEPPYGTYPIKPQEDVRVKIAILLHDEFDEVMDVRVMTYYQDIANKILAIVKGG